MSTESIPCTYCDGRAWLVDSAVIYHGRSYGYVYLCGPCDAYVGCHKGTTIPLGTPAKEPLRKARNRAHGSFDPLWKNKYFRSRGAAYRALAEAMKIDYNDCHIAMFDEDQCAMVVAMSQAFDPAQSRGSHRKNVKRLGNVFAHCGRVTDSARIVQKNAREVRGQNFVVFADQRARMLVRIREARDELNKAIELVERLDVIEFDDDEPVLELVEA